MKIHMVKQGDTLYLIAKKYNVPLEELIKANPEISNPDELAIGTKVKIHSQPKSAVEVMHQHIVQQGDSLWKLSKAWGIHLSDMIKANPQLKNPNALLTGEVVNIPKAGSSNEGVGSAGHGGMHGKAPTGVKPETGAKPNTGAKAETAPMPMPLPTPLPAPVPMPMPMPISEKIAPVMPHAPAYPVQDIQPIYGGHAAPSKDLFLQYPTPAVVAGAVADDCPPDYGFGFPSAVSPAVQPQGGYGHAPIQGIGSLDGQLGNLGGNIHGGIGGWNDSNYGGHTAHNAPFPNAVSPASVGGCSSCGAPIGWPNTAGAFQGMGNPSAVQPIASSPYDGYGYGTVPQVGGVQAGAMPNVGYPGYYGSYPNAQVAGAVSPADLISPGHGFSYAGAEPYAYGGFPSIPAFPSLGSMTQPESFDGSYRDPSDESGEVEHQPAAQAKPRAAKAKPRHAAAKKSKPRRKESLPWINW
ncbi:LysM peptidoglycan-binding domain-containing protein [Cohnella sp. GCM10027633]|uniref:LysM peptidoglycan-binding domain-containing protein n=1 Tax=unclassified Cohnella TaxID=2636738 RepID=UPI0036312DD8